MDSNDGHHDPSDDFEPSSSKNKSPATNSSNKTSSPAAWSNNSSATNSSTKNPSPAWSNNSSATNSSNKNPSPAWSNNSSATNYSQNPSLSTTFSKNGSCSTDQSAGRSQNRPKRIPPKPPPKPSWLRSRPLSVKDDDPEQRKRMEMRDRLTGMTIDPDMDLPSQREEKSPGDQETQGTVNNPPGEAMHVIGDQCMRCCWDNQNCDLSVNCNFCERRGFVCIRGVESLWLYGGSTGSSNGIIPVRRSLGAIIVEARKRMSAPMGLTIWDKTYEASLDSRDPRAILEFRWDGSGPSSVIALNTRTLTELPEFSTLSTTFHSSFKSALLDTIPTPVFRRLRDVKKLVSYTESMFQKLTLITSIAGADLYAIPGDLLPGRVTLALLLASLTESIARESEAFTMSLIDCLPQVRVNPSYDVWLAVGVYHFIVTCLSDFEFPSSVAGIFTRMKSGLEEVATAIEDCFRESYSSKFADLTLDSLNDHPRDNREEHWTVFEKHVDFPPMCRPLNVAFYFASAPPANDSLPGFSCVRTTSAGVPTGLDRPAEPFESPPTSVSQLLSHGFQDLVVPPSAPNLTTTESDQIVETSLQEALDRYDVGAVRTLLKNRFDSIAKDEFSWLGELDAVGYTRDEIAELLLEDANDSPWIFFEPSEFDNAQIKPGIHVSGCAHRGNLGDFPVLERSVYPSDSSKSEREDAVKKAVQELCGIAGVVPVSRDVGNWGGNVRFEEDNSVAIVSYGFPANEDNPPPSAIVSRIRRALKRFCMAAGQVQAAGLCCDSFTTLQHTTRSMGKDKLGQPQVELCEINLNLAVELLKETQPPVRFVDASGETRRRPTAELILGSLSPCMASSPHEDRIDHILHTWSLAVQLLCLGFLSYCQAHIGAIQPFFLDTPQRKIVLLGSNTSQNCGHITAELTDLTCVGNMTRKPVLTFCTNRSTKVSAPGDVRYDMLASAEDFLDSWGPGHYVKCSNATEKPCAIIVGGGIISAADEDGDRFHWSDGVWHDGPLSGEINPSTKIVIGAIVTVNKNCMIDERECWKKSLPAMEHLGVHGSRWQLQEREGGFHAGEYIILAYTQTWNKIPGTTLKQLRLEEEDDLLISFLECNWGLQMSFCTSVSRRIPLRELVADVLPIFAKDSLRQNLWEDLNRNHNIMDAFQGNDLRAWLAGLTSELQEYVLKLIRRILVLLKHTGVDREGKNLSIAWPQEDDVYRCFRIPCKKQSFWARILADSEDCATFAYVSSKCLETDKVKCSGPSPVWRNASALLETAVIHHQTIPTTVSGALEHEQTFFFKKLDSFLLVRVHRPDQTGNASLDVSPSTIPEKFQRRLTSEQTKRECRLRERQTNHESAEQVVVCAMLAKKAYQQFLPSARFRVPLNP
ncbi:hypothetical protein FQN54_004018 [Arachnomyces sp. PD_36]|nr:hypothetical protein FQN54_004018 [Arachnomyces sp. PD_36]